MIVSVCKILLFKYDIENHSFNKCYITYRHTILNTVKTSSDQHHLQIIPSENNQMQAYSKIKHRNQRIMITLVYTF